MNIKLTYANMEKLEEVLSLSQDGCRERTITISLMMDALDEVTKTLHISKKAMNGVKCCIDCNAQDFPRAYKYTPRSTIFSAEFKNGNWAITDIVRERTHPAGQRIKIELTEDAKAAIIKQYERIY